MYIRFSMPSGGDAVADFDQFYCRDWNDGRPAIVAFSTTARQVERPLQFFNTKADAEKRLGEIMAAMEAGKQAFDMKG